MWLYVFDVDYVYAYVVHEKEMGVFQVWQPIPCAYGKEKGKSEGLI